MKVFDRAYQFYDGLPTWGKAVAVIGGAGIAWFGVLNPLRKLIISKLDQAKMAKEGQKAGDELSKLKKQGVNPTISPAQAESFSNSLVSAFAGCGTDEDAIYNIMKQLKNNADVYLLISTYGIRKYDGCMWGTTEKSLSGAISDELDWLEKMAVNKILEGNKVSFQFT